MIFVDTNVFMYFVGSPHPLQGAARNFFRHAQRDETPLYTSAEVLQEIVHVYTSQRRMETLDAALLLIDRYGVVVWPLEREDVLAAVRLSERHPELSARDLCHLASCRRRGVREIMTFDEALAAASRRPRLTG